MNLHLLGCTYRSKVSVILRFKFRNSNIENRNKHENRMTKIQNTISNI